VPLKITKDDYREEAIGFLMSLHLDPTAMKMKISNTCDDGLVVILRCINVFGYHFTSGILIIVIMCVMYWVGRESFIKKL
jgi:hypothetical protein